jgi:hypothetical protein
MNTSTSNTIRTIPTGDQTFAVVRHFWAVVTEPYSRRELARDILVANPDIVKEILHWPQRPSESQLNPRLLIWILSHSAARMQRGLDARNVVCTELARLLSCVRTSRKDGPESYC